MTRNGSEKNRDEQKRNSKETLSKELKTKGTALRGIETESNSGVLSRKGKDMEKIWAEKRWN